MKRGMKRGRSCQTLTLPLGLVALGIITVILVFTRPNATPQAAELQQNNPTQTYTVTPSDTATQYYTPPPHTQTATRTNTPTYTNTPEHTNTATRTPNDDEDNDPEPTATNDNDNDDDPEQNTPTSTATQTPPVDTTTPTHTNTPIPELDNRDCFLGQTIVIEPRMEREYAPPQTHLLIFFRGRAVGGAVSDRTGFYHARLTIGGEMTGDVFRAVGEGAPEVQEGDLQYPVEIRIRETRELVHTVVCNMWAVTHTPTIPVIPTRQDMR